MFVYARVFVFCQFSFLNVRNYFLFQVPVASWQQHIPTLMLYLMTPKMSCVKKTLRVGGVKNKVIKTSVGLVKKLLLHVTLLMAVCVPVVRLIE